MAIDVSITLNDARETELNLQTDEANIVRRRLGLADLTNRALLRQDVQERLDLQARKREDAKDLSRRELRAMMTEADRAALDALYAKYQQQALAGGSR